jgi:tetratricopeptide (TPR) repeat protein
MRQHADEKGVLSFYHPQRQLPDMPPLPLRWQLKGWLWSIVRSRMRGSCLVFPVIGAWLWAIWATFRGVSESYLAAAAIVGVLALLYLGVMAVAQIDRRKGYFLRGMNHFDESRWDSAIADLLQAMRPSLRDVWLYAPGMQERGWERICIALLELEEPSDAEEAVKYAFHQIGPVVGLYECLGISLNRQRRGAEAIEAWEIALEGARNDEERERIKKRIDKTRLLIGSTDQPS